MEQRALDICTLCAICAFSIISLPLYSMLLMSPKFRCMRLGVDEIRVSNSCENLVTGSQ